MPPAGDASGHPTAAATTVFRKMAFIFSLMDLAWAMHGQGRAPSLGCHCHHMSESEGEKLDFGLTDVQRHPGRPGAHCKKHQDALPAPRGSALSLRPKSYCLFGSKRLISRLLTVRSARRDTQSRTLVRSYRRRR